MKPHLSMSSKTDMTRPPLTRQGTPPGWYLDWPTRTFHAIGFNPGASVPPQLHPNCYRNKDEALKALKR